MLPMFISYSFKKSPKDIPSYVYMGTGAIGVVFSIYMQFFGLWVAGFLIGVGVVFAVITWMQKGKGG